MYVVILRINIYREHVDTKNKVHQQYQPSSMMYTRKTI